MINGYHHQRVLQAVAHTVARTNQRSSLLIAVEQYGHAIYGIGHSVTEAVEDAERWLESSVDLDCICWISNPVVGEYRLVYMTAALAQHVEREGGCLTYYETADHILCTREEALRGKR